MHCDVSTANKQVVVSDPGSGKSGAYKSRVCHKDDMWLDMRCVPFVRHCCAAHLCTLCFQNKAALQDVYTLVPTPACWLERCRVSC
jgi:hypothetical protein